MKKNYFTKNFKKSFLTLSIVFCALFANSAFAQGPIKNIGWIGATGDSWTTSENWNYPANTSVATFGFSATAPISIITLTVANTDIAVGDKVSGFGIPVGTTITAIDATQKIITISNSTLAAVGTPGTNVQFTFATPKAATGAPTGTEIALISNGTNPNIPAGTYNIGGLTISNETGPVTGSTLTIPADVDIFVDSSTNEAVLVKGGNIINNGYFEIKSSLGNGTNSALYGSNNTAAGYGMTFSLPTVVPSVPTEYMYSGSGTLVIDTSVGNNFSGGILFNGAHANAANSTYKILFNGTTTIRLSPVKSATNAASTHFMRAVGISALASCKVILGGTGFDIGDSFSGSANGLLASSGGGINVTIASGTTINVYSNDNNPSPIMSMYSFGATAIPSFITNKGTINMKGTMPRSPITLSAQNQAIVNFVNDGTLDIDVNSTLVSQGGIFIGNNQGATLPADVNVINNGTLTIKTLLNAVSWGSTIVMTTNAGAPNLHVINNGTLNLIGSNYAAGAKDFNPALNPPPVTVPVTAPQTGASRITNSGTINTNQQLRNFYTINTSTGVINYASTSESPLKLCTFTVPIATAAAIGTTYTDSNSNVYTVLVAKVAATGTTLVTSVASNAVNPSVVAYAAGPPEVLASALTKTGAGDGAGSIVFTAITTNNNTAFYSTTLNSGTINTNAGITAMTGITGFTSPDATSVLSPGGDTGNAIVLFENFPNVGGVPNDNLILRGTLKMQASGSTTAGIDFDQMKLTGALDQIDISAAILDVTGLYTPAALTTIDIITTNIIGGFEGAVLGEFSSVVGLPAKWTVVYTGGLGGKVQLVYDPTLGTDKFSTFKFSAYPNPTSDQLNLSAAKTISKVELFSLLGQRVLSTTINANQKQLSISNLQNGLYLMEVTIDNAKQAFKIVKQ